MQRFKVTLIGSVVHSATRAFVVELPDDVNPQTLNEDTLMALADQARVAWEFGTEGFVSANDFTVEGVTPQGR